MRQAAIDAGDPIPRVAICPDLSPENIIVWNGFTALHTCRLLDGGAIPWTAIAQFCDRYGIEDGDDFEALIRAMDNHYLEWLDKERKKAVAKH